MCQLRSFSFHAFVSQISCLCSSSSGELMFSQSSYPLFLFPSKMLCISLWPELASHQLLWESKYFMSSATCGRGRPGIGWLRSRLVCLPQDWWALLNAVETKCTYTQMDWKRVSQCVPGGHGPFSMVDGNTRRWQYCWWVNGTCLHLQLNGLVIFSKLWTKERLWGKGSLQFIFEINWVEWEQLKSRMCWIHVRLVCFRGSIICY